MAILGLSRAIPLVMSVPGTLAAGDGWDLHNLDFPAILWKVDMVVAANGASSGNTDFVIERTPSGGAAGDLWTVASGCGRIAHDSTNLYLTWDWENANMTGYAAGQLYPPTGARLAKGDALKLNIDAVPGTASTSLTVRLWLVPLAD